VRPGLSEVALMVFDRRVAMRVTAAFAAVVMLVGLTPRQAGAQVQKLELGAKVLEAIYTAVTRTAVRNPSSLEIGSGLLLRNSSVASLARSGRTVLVPTLADGTPGLTGSVRWRATGLSDTLARNSLCTGTPQQAFACSEIQRRIRLGTLSRTGADLGSLSRELDSTYSSRAIVLQTRPVSYGLSKLSPQYGADAMRLPMQPVRMLTLQLDRSVVAPLGSDAFRAYDQLGRLPFDGNVRFVSFATDSATRTSLSGLGDRASVITGDSLGDAEQQFRSALQRYRGRQVFVVFHSEGGALTVRDAAGVRYAMQPAAVEAIARDYGVTIFPVTCRGAATWSRGYAADIDAPLMVRYILDAARGARTQRDFVRALAPPGNDVMIDASSFAREGTLTLGFQRRRLAAYSALGLSGASTITLAARAATR
jgi:hypothetical protein